MLTSNGCCVTMVCFFSVLVHLFRFLLLLCSLIVTIVSSFQEEHNSNDGSTIGIRLSRVIMQV